MTKSGQFWFLTKRTGETWQTLLVSPLKFGERSRPLSGSCFVQKLAVQSHGCMNMVGVSKNVPSVTQLRTLPGIVHGDIKPENVLIYKGGTGFYTARVSDAGYSTQWVNEEDRIKMPKSWPWYAPEHDRDRFKPAQARKMDIFSFGMLCLWVLFEKYLSGITPLPQDVSWAERYFQGKEKTHLSKNTLEDLKRGDELTMFAQQLVLAERNIDNDKKQTLERLFRTSLGCNPDERNASPGELFGQLRLDQ